MKRFKQILTRRVGRHSQLGQSVVMLAIALIMLIAFVGLVTDIALLFVRYSTLRRAVDAAAIAAAGQIREDSDYMNLVTAAYQFIQLHGIGVEDVSQIFVETCENFPADTPDPELCQVKCDPNGPNPNDPDKCKLMIDTTQLPRKLVRVTAQIDSPTTFLQLIGWKTVRLEASAVGETAVVDLALVLDTSESMSELTCFDGLDCNGNDYAGFTEADLSDRYNDEFPPPDRNDKVGIPDSFRAGGNVRDEKWGYYCNDPNGDGYFDDLVCHPFYEVREAAANFIKKLDFVRGDRVAIITFDRYALPRYPDCEYDNPFFPQLGCKNTEANGYPESQRWTGYPMISDEIVAAEVIKGDPAHSNTQRRGIGVYVNNASIGTDFFTAYKWNQCWFANDDAANGRMTKFYSCNNGNNEDCRVWAPCGNTNLGGGIETANHVLAGGAEGRWKNPAAVWVMVLLTDGGANATTVYPSVASNYPDGFCPLSTILSFVDTRNYPPRSNDTDPGTASPLCRDVSAYTRHVLDEDDVPNGIELYDADDYARDKADDAGLADTGNFIAMFTIGLGTELIDGQPPLGQAPNHPWHGEALLRYIADVGDNGIRDGSGDPEHIVHADGTVDTHNNVNPASISECENTPHGDIVEYNKRANGQSNNWKDPSCGNYFFAPDPNNLEPIFAEIASRMFTRVTR